MQLCQVRRPDGGRAAGIVQGDSVRVLNATLASLLHAANPGEAARAAAVVDTMPLAESALLPPVDEQEVWAAGVTYIRSKVAREEESAAQGGARFYDMVYTAERPELFFKAPAYRVIGTGGTVRIRRDARWSVPEPELALMLSPAGAIVGYTIGNDMSSRDIEGENPLYLPQAKFYDGACAWDRPWPWPVRYRQVRRCGSP